MSALNESELHTSTAHTSYITSYITPHTSHLHSSQPIQRIKLDQARSSGRSASRPAPFGGAQAGPQGRGMRRRLARGAPGARRDQLGPPRHEARHTRPPLPDVALPAPEGVVPGDVPSAAPGMGRSGC